MELAELQARRTAELHQLRTDDPVAWAICIMPRGTKALTEALAFTTEEVEEAIDRLTKAKEIRREKYKSVWVYHPNSQRLTRLNRRARNIKYKNRKIEEV